VVLVVLLLADAVPLEALLVEVVVVVVVDIAFQTIASSSAEFIKGMQLMHVYSTGTQLFTNPATNKPVRCRCMFALFYDAPKLNPSTADACNPVHSGVPMPEASAANTFASFDSVVTKRHTMQTVVYVAGTLAKALFDTGASGGNYISKRYCAINGIKLTSAATPISVVGVLRSTADASSCCKLTVRVSALTDTLLFYAIDMLGTFDMIKGNAWLHDRQAIMDFPNSCCHAYKNGRKYTTQETAQEEAHVTCCCTACCCCCCCCGYSV
jgi:hypothetical protein